MFRGLLRPGQGFKPFTVLRRVGGLTESGRAHTGKLVPQGEFYGIISQADPAEKEQWKQAGTPVTHTILQRGTQNRAYPTDVLELPPDETYPLPRRFQVVGEPKNPGELGHFLIYRVEERQDLK